MSKEFIQGAKGSQSLDLACRQQRQLLYFTTSEIQEEVRVDYFNKYVESKYYTNDVFLNWVKSVFKNDNFLSFAKYYRNPNPSSKLVNTRIKEPLSRVFFSEDNHFNYWINGKEVEYPKELEDDFEERLFDHIIFRYNDIIVHDLNNYGEPFRYFVDIENVVSIEVSGNDIERVAYSGKINFEGREIYGYVYLDAEKYEFYDTGYDFVTSETHDFGQCPATFVVKKKFDNDPIVKESIFSYLRAELEEYTFLKTLQRITHPNGAFPIVTQIEAKMLNEDYIDFDNNGNEPMSIDQINGQVSQEARQTAGSGKGSNLQAGSIITVPAITKEDGSIDMELSKNFFTYYHTPVDILNYINDRIKELESEIITSSLGSYSERNDVSMTELQTRKGIVSMEDKLRWFSNTMSFSRGKSDNMMLSLKYGKGFVKSDIFYGSDFFMQTESMIYDMFKIAPNAIERKNLLVRLAQRRNMYNKEKSKKEVILYKLLPYCSDNEFDLAVEKERVSDKVFEFQTRFNYWIAQFESMYGGICAFWDGLNANESEKIVLLNNLIFNLIKIDNGKETDSES